MMKKEYLYQLIALGVYFISMLFEVHHGEVEYLGQPFHFFLLTLYHAMLFGVVNYILVPKFFHKKKIPVFFILSLATVALFALLEELVVERVLFSGSRGKDALDVFDIYYFIGEVGIALLSFIIIKLLFNYFEYQKKLISIERDSLQNELKFLRSQIQPHVLFNSLNNLYEYTLSKSDKAPELVLQLSKVLRYLLYETDKELILLRKEVQFLEEYIALQTTQLENRGKVDLRIEWDKSHETLFIAPFILIPFIENSFKHSLKSKENGIEINITIKIKEQTFELFVSNTYEHYPRTEADLTKSGIGLKNVKKRLNLLYPENHTLNVTEDKLVYSVHLLLNLNS